MILDNQSAEDLEFDLIRLMLHDLCKGESAKLRMVDLRPHHDPRMVVPLLLQVKDLVDIRREGLNFPALEFEELEEDLRVLRVERSTLQADGFTRIRLASALCNDILLFIGRNEGRFGHIVALLHPLWFTEDIIQLIDEVFDHKGQVKDSASPELQEIRRNIVSVKRQINRNFAKEIKSLTDQGFLADTREAYVNERRVVAVMSSYKRQVQGVVLGSSRTGNFTFIEPQINVPLNFEHEMLLDDERKEIQRILRRLSADLRKFLSLIEGYQTVLTELDFIQAKARLALELDAHMPAVENEPCIELHDAFHPLLLLANRREGKKTMPQSLHMDKFSRMLVISGPNAGGKSITLKTVGLLQVMLQSGLLVTTGPNSRMCFFQAVLTDIGDHQSIENQLSTYSYRLKRMKSFLETANRRTLLLLDEFGTGSDPDLGGALAEVFFEELYRKKAFGVITTHYSNIKLKAAELRNAINGCMLFDRETLEPLFKLSVGQPGSSFTFEVAESNGIPRELINEAKNKLDERKVRMDELLSSLQQERTRYEALILRTAKAEAEATAAREEFERRKTQFHDKLRTQQELIEKNNKFLTKGKRLQSYIELYTGKGSNKPLMQEILKYLAVEKSRIEDRIKSEKLKELSAKTAKQPKLRPDSEQVQAQITIGSVVKLRKGKQSGTVMELEGNEALVAFGVFKTRIHLDRLVFIK
jgi:DNA mismatch repair protein MutS2